jgi:transposase
MREVTMMTEDFAAFLGIDWADQKHAIAYSRAGSSEVVEETIKHDAKELEDLVLRLRKEFPKGRIAVIVEQSRGALFYGLIKYDFLVLFLPNPKSFARYREAFSCSGAKSDPSDALLLLDLLQKHHSQLRAWSPEDAQTRELRMLAEYRRRLIHDRSRLINRLTSILKCYFPEALQWTGDLSRKLALDFLQRWSTLQAVKKVRPSTLRCFYQKHGSRRKQLMEKRISQIRNAIPFTTDPAIICASQRMVQAIVGQLVALRQSVEEFDLKIAQLFEQHPDQFLYEGLPGAGPVLQPRLAVAFGSDRSRFQSALEVQQFSGIAPVTEGSGKSKTIYRRRACPKFILQTFHEFADHSVARSRWARAYYLQQKQRGNSHHAAVRSLAYKWIRILFRCWKNQVVYNEDTYLQSLIRSRSPLVALIA